MKETLIEKLKNNGLFTEDQLKEMDIDQLERICDYLIKEYKIPCVKNCDKKPGCPCCGGKGYNIIIFKDDRRIY